MNQPTIAARWQSFNREADIHPTQRQEMRRAFYAGAQSLFNIVMFELDPSDEITAADEAKIAAIHEELQQFGRDIEEGRA
jgi:hypothetical protein